MPAAPAIEKQGTFEEVSEEYAAFLDKFKPKKTTDDCYTPPAVYEAVRGWVFARYSLDPATAVIRPFYPGKDYTRADYPEGCVVLDNPPFSIIGKIVEWYQAHRVRFFLFAPYLTNIGIGRGTGCGHVLAPWIVRYENGAEVPTSFVTNLDPDVVAESAPDLRQLVAEADAEGRRGTVKELPSYIYPPEVVTSASLGSLAAHGTPFRLRRGDCAFIRALDSQKAAGKAIFGGGFLLSPRAAAERAAAERVDARFWPLSDRERQICAMLERKSNNPPTP